MRLVTHLLEYRLGNVVVAAPQSVARSALVN